MRTRSLLLVSTLAIGSLAPLVLAGPASAKDKFCGDVLALDKKMTAMSAAKDPAEIGKSLTDFASSMKKVEGRAPKAISGDWKKMGEGMTKMATTMTKLNKLTVAQMAKESPKIEAEIEKISADKVYTVAGDKVTAWAKKACGIDLN